MSRIRAKQLGVRNPTRLDELISVSNSLVQSILETPPFDPKQLPQISIKAEEE